MKAVQQSLWPTNIPVAETTIQARPESLCEIGWVNIDKGPRKKITRIKYLLSVLTSRAKDD